MQVLPEAHCAVKDGLVQCSPLFMAKTKIICLWLRTVRSQVFEATMERHSRESHCLQDLMLAHHVPWSSKQSDKEDPLSLSVIVPSKSVKKMILGLDLIYGKSTDPMVGK